MKQLKQKLQIILASLLVVLGVAAVTTPSAVYADCAKPANAAEKAQCDAAKERKSAACDGAEAAGVTNCGNSGAAKSGFQNIIRSVINILSVVVGAVSVIMIIIGGFRYVVSNGDSNGMQGAKNTILYAIIGLVIVLFAQVIVAFVIDRATS